MSDAGRPLSAYEAWILAREQQYAQQQAQRPTPSPDGMVVAPHYFKDPPPGQPRTTTIEAGRSQFDNMSDPFERETADDRRHRYAQVARDAERMTRASGSNTVRDRNAERHAGWHSELVRVTGGRLETRWIRDAPEP